MTSRRCLPSHFVAEYFSVARSRCKFKLVRRSLSIWTGPVAKWRFAKVSGWKEVVSDAHEKPRRVLTAASETYNAASTDAAT